MSRAVVAWLERFVRRYVPWGMLDALTVALGFVAAWLGYTLRAPEITADTLIFVLLAVGLFWVMNALFGVYQRLWRYAVASEVLVLGGAVAVSTGLLLLADLVWPGDRPVPPNVVPLTGLLAFVGFVGLRYRIRVWTGLLWRLRALRGRFPASHQRLLIVGAGEAGQLLAWRLLQNGQHELVGFVDDDPNKHGMRVHGVKVMGDHHALKTLVERHAVDLIVIAIHNISGDPFRHLLDACEQTSARIQVLPSLAHLMEGSGYKTFVRDVTPEDLLGRKQVAVDLETCRALIGGRRVLVTGAAGSIGSELCRQLLALGPTHLLMLDQDESGLYDLQMELLSQRAPLGPVELVPLVGDITHGDKVRGIIETYRPHLVFHAAAYKHVPYMEDHPDEAVRVNVGGTRIVAAWAAKCGVERFVLISTDKAVNPSSVMGATKRVDELMVLSSDVFFRPTNTAPQGTEARGAARGAESPGPTLFTAVRFGNVLRSRGSVVPLFERQIDQGGPITVTHPEMTRYFMSLSEAVSLLIQAAAFTQGGDLFILDMGERMRIEELARRLIRLRGLRPGVDIPIVYTGTRPGEKLHEDLLAPGEERFPTPHAQIFRISPCPSDRIEPSEVEELLALLERGTKAEIAAALRQLIERHSVPAVQ